MRGVRTSTSWASLLYVLLTDLVVFGIAAFAFLLSRWRLTYLRRRRRSPSTRIYDDEEYDDEKGIENRRCKFDSLRSLTHFLCGVSTDDVARVSKSETVAQYLRFQRKLICVLGLFSVFAVALLPPLDLLATHDVDDQTLSSTTLEIVPPGAEVLWMHVLLTWLFGVIIVYAFYIRPRNRRRRTPKNEHADAIEARQSSCAAVFPRALRAARC